MSSSSSSPALSKLQSSPMAPSTEEDSAKLQRLGFVQSYTEAAVSKGYGLTASVYSTGRQYTPTFLEDRVTAVEGKVSEIGTQYGAPLLNTVQDRSQQVLGIVDQQVDSVAKTASGFYSKQSDYIASAIKNQQEYHSKNLQHFKEARDAYLQQAKEAVAFLKKEGLTGTAKYAADSVSHAVEQARDAVPNFIGGQANLLLERVSQAWDRLQQVPAVQKTLDAVSPSVELAKKKYLAAHDAVVQAPAYDKAVQTGADVLSKVQTTYVYQTAANRVYPVISPYADPVVDKASPYVNSVIDHLKPQHTVSAQS